MAQIEDERVGGSKRQRKCHSLYVPSVSGELRSKLTLADDDESCIDLLDRYVQEDLVERIKKGNLIGEAVQHWLQHWTDRCDKIPYNILCDLLKRLSEACTSHYAICEDTFKVDDDGSDDESDNSDRVVAAHVDLAKKNVFDNSQNSEKKDPNSSLGDNLVSFWKILVNLWLKNPSSSSPAVELPVWVGCMTDVVADLVLSCDRVRLFGVSLVGLHLAQSLIHSAITTGENESKIVGVIDDLISCFTTKDQIIWISWIHCLGTWIWSYPFLFLQDKFEQHFHTALDLNLKMIEGIKSEDKDEEDDSSEDEEDDSSEDEDDVNEDEDEDVREEEEEAPAAPMTEDDRKIAKAKSDVRKATIRALRNLASVADAHKFLRRNFALRFVDKLIALTDDHNIIVRFLAGDLVIELLCCRLLSDNNVPKSFHCLYVRRPKIDHKLEDLVPDPVLNKYSISKPGSKVLSSTLQYLKEHPRNSYLICFLIKFNWKQEGGAILIEDFKCITSILLDSNLPDDEATNLIRLLFFSVRNAVGANLYEKEETKSFTEAQERKYERLKKQVTLSIMESCPAILYKYLEDSAKVTLLLKIIMCMDIQLYAFRLQEKEFRAMLGHIRKAFFTHDDVDTLTTCVKALSFCVSYSWGACQEAVSLNFKEFGDELIAKLKASFTAVMSMEDKDEDDAMVVDGHGGESLFVNMKRLYELSASARLYRLYPQFDKKLVEMVNEVFISGVEINPTILKSVKRGVDYGVDRAAEYHFTDLPDSVSYLKYHIMPFVSLLNRDDDGHPIIEKIKTIIGYNDWEEEEEEEDDEDVPWREEDVLLRNLGQIIDEF